MSGQADNGLSLMGLARRLEALERENERMRLENSELRDELAALNGSETRQAVEPAFEGRVSRRALLSKAGAAAVAAVAAGTLLNPREARASHYSTDFIGANTVSTHSLDAISETSFAAIVAIASSNVQATVDASNNGSKPAVEAANLAAGQGLLGRSTNGTGVDGRGVIGVLGRSGHTGQAAVYGEHHTSAGPGVVGDANGPDYAGVLGRNSDGTGVWGQSSKTGYSGVYGQHTGSLGFGVVGDGRGNSNAGVLGRNLSGYGGQFEGGRAQLKFKPAGSAGKPTGVHTKGEIYMDSAATLFVCTASGTPGKWRKISTTAV